MQKVKVSICGRTYCLSTEESEEYVNQLAARLDARINRFMDENPGTSLLSAAVMTALELSDDASRNEDDADNFRGQLKTYAEEAAAAKTMVDKLRRAVEGLVQENRKLKSDLELLTLRDQVEQAPAEEPAPETEPAQPEQPAEEVRDEPPARTVSLVGIGMGTPSGMTLEAEQAIEEADLLIGAGRMLESSVHKDKPSYNAYDPQKIVDYMELHPEYVHVAVLLSGDIGFYSGAKRLYDALDGKGYEIRTVCGISSVVYFCSRLRTSWEDVCLKSAHGRNANLPGAVRTHRKTFTLLSRGDSVGRLCRELEEYGLSHVRIHVGERLGYPEEKISSGTPADLADGTYDGLCVALIENPEATDASRSCISDEEFLRGKAPMTKSEVRCLSAAKLHLPSDAVVYDVGAGTGSVTVEMALQAPDGMVYAIERNAEACGLIEQNKRKFCTPNIRVVKGLAPEAMEDLPAPTHAFIGGSAGNLKEILECLLEKNPKIRLVINTVTLETVGEVMQCLKELPLIEEEILSVNTARSRKLGAYHLMTGQNPIYIITCRGGEEA